MAMLQDMNDITVNDLKHLIGHVSYLSVAIRDVNDREKSEWIFIKQLSTRKIKVYKNVHNFEHLLIYSPFIDKARFAADELAYISNRSKSKKDN